MIPLFDESAAALVLGISRDQLCRLAREGKIPHIKVGRRLRFDGDVLKEWAVERSRDSLESSPRDSDDRVNSTQGENGGLS